MKNLQKELKKYEWQEKLRDGSGKKIQPWLRWHSLSARLTLWIFELGVNVRSPRDAGPYEAESHAGVTAVERYI